MYTKKIAALEILNRKAYIPATLSFMDSIVGNHTEYSVSRYNKLRFVVTEMLERRVERAYPGAVGTLYVELFIKDDFFEVSVRDEGVPEWIDFNYNKELIETNDKDFLKFTMKKFIDRVGVEKLGRDGQRVYVCQKIINPLHFKEPKPYKKIEVLDNHITIKPVKTKEDAIEAIRCIYNEYKYSYPYEKLYYVDNFMRMLENKDFVSFLAVNEHGQIAGHFALSFSEFFKGMPEFSCVVTRKEFRGMGLLSKYMDYSIEFAKKHGYRAIMCQPAAFHPMTQKSSIKHGLTATSVLWSYIPAELDSEYNAESQRLDLFVCVKILDKNADCVIYPPRELAEFAEKIYTRAAYKHRICMEGAVAENTRIRFEESSSQKMTRIVLGESGSDIEQLLKAVVADSIRKKNEMIELFISLRSPSCEYGYLKAKSSGFIFSGLIPGAENDDYLVMQLLFQDKIHYERLVMVGEFEELTCDIKKIVNDSVV